jgi:hypothetical protein
MTPWAIAAGAVFIALLLAILLLLGSYVLAHVPETDSG